MGDFSNSSGSEWEVVSLSLSSHSLLSASTSLDTTGGGAATGTWNGGGDAPFATTLNSAYFLCSPTASSPEAPLKQRPSSSNIEEEEEGELLSSIPEPDVDADEKKKKKTKEERMAVTPKVPAELLGAEESLPLATTTKEVSQQQEEDVYFHNVVPRVLDDDAFPYGQFYSRTLLQQNAVSQTDTTK